MVDYSHQGDDPTPLGDMARDLTKRTQDFLERLKALGGSAKGLKSGGLTEQWISLLVTGTSLTRLPMRQLQTLSDAVQQHRDNIARMRDQLEVFDNQLKLFSDSFEPLLKWNDQWSKSQDAMLRYLRPSES